jgi:hypothetical protein
VRPPATRRAHAAGTSVGREEREHRGEWTVLRREPDAVPVRARAKILELKRNGSFSAYATGFTPILGVETDKRDNLYVLETFACLPQLPCVPAPFAAGTGQVVRLGRDGSREVIATGLTFPTSMRFGPDGALYVSNKGYGLPPGAERF